MADPNPIADLFVESFNRDLASLGCPARVAVATADGSDELEYRDPNDGILCMIPTTTTPEMAAIAYRLYRSGVVRGVRAGKFLALAELCATTADVAADDSA